MSQDTISDGLNMIMNAKRAGKSSVVVKRYSKVLVEILDIMKSAGVIDYKIDTEKREILIDAKKLNKCQAIKPRFSANKKNMDKYIKRFLPARNVGLIIISTNKGMVLHREAKEKGIGGSLIAYFY